jgi:hypothetical protein
MKFFYPLALVILILLAACSPTAVNPNEVASNSSSGEPAGNVLKTELPAQTKQVGQSLSDLLAQQTPEPQQSGNSAQPEVSWDTNPQTLILKATFCCGMMPEFAKLNSIPDAQVWGDGRILWTQMEANNTQRKVLEGKLTSEQMSSLLQEAVDAGFFGWQERYTSANPPTDMPSQCLSIHLQSQSKQVCEYYEGAPQAFHDIYERAANGFGATGQDYTPEKGYLTAYPMQSSSQDGGQPQPPTWDAQSTGLSLAQAEQGTWVQGPALKAAWDLVNNNPFGAYVQDGEDSYRISLQIPGVSMAEPPK